MALFFRQKCECQCSELEGPCDDCDCACPVGTVYVEISGCHEHCTDTESPDPEFPESFCQRSDYSQANGSYSINVTGDCEDSGAVPDLALGQYSVTECYGSEDLEDCPISAGQCPCSGGEDCCYDLCEDETGENNKVYLTVFSCSIDSEGKGKLFVELSFDCWGSGNAGHFEGYLNAPLEPTAHQAEETGCQITVTTTAPP